MKRFFHRENYYKLTLLLLSCAISVGGGEIVLRNLSTDEYYVWRPNLRTIFRPLPEVMPGISGESRIFINSSGIRGDAFSADQKYRILCIGGSTTECLYLDESETWPYLLQKKLNEKLGRPVIWVGNVGKSGCNTIHHILQIETLLPQYPRIDAVIMLIGMNDLIRRLRQDVNYRPFSLETPAYKKKLLRSAFSVIPNPDKDKWAPAYKRTEIWRRARKFKERFFEPPEVKNSLKIQDEAGKFYVTRRKQRQNAVAIRHALPDLSSALEEYAQNVNTIIDFARNRGTRVIFLTQPVLWKTDLPKELRNLLWFGGIGDFQEEIGKEYYSVEALAVAMEMYNETLLTTCRIRGVECVDLASLLPKDTTVFYDDCHFNEGGAKKVAEILVRYLLQQDPFK